MSGGQNVTVQAQKAANSWYTASTYFDGFGRQISTLSDGPAQSNGNPTTIRVDTYYDTNGRVWEKSYPYLLDKASGNQLEAPRQVVYKYDGLGRRTRTTYPDNTYTAVSYSGGVAAFTDRNGNTTRQEHRDGFGRLTQVTEIPSSGANPLISTYQYDSLGNLRFVTDAKGSTTGIAYDALSRKIGMSDPSMGDWYYGYDNNGNLTSQTDANGNTILFQYDPLGRLSCKTYPNQTTITYSYDASSSQNYGIGRLAGVVDNSPQNSSGTTQFSYDEQGRTTQVLRTIDNTVYTTQFSYDPLNRITNIVYPDYDRANYAYDAAGNVSTVSNKDGTVTYAAFSLYNAFGQVGNITFGNQASTTFSYKSPVNRLTELSMTIPGSGIVHDFTYGYDGNGNVLSIADQVDPTQTFTYDWLNRLTQATGAYGTLNYNPDATGNIDNPAAANSNYKAQQQTLTYDYDNRVTGVSTGGSSVASFVYDYTGARVKKISGADVVTYISRLFEVRNGSVMKHVFAGGRRIATVSGGSTYYYHTDHLGSLRIATDAHDNLVQTAAYDPYGNLDPNHSSGSIIPYTFTGHELDPETGLYYFGARYYDPAQGRFITPDSIVQSPGDPQSLNRYAYARNNPLAFIDPNGFGFFSFLEDLFAALFGAIVTVLTWGVAGPVIAGMLGGMVAGATDAAMHGACLLGVIQGAFMGAIGGAIGGAAFLADIPWPVTAAVGLAIAGGTGGVKGLESFAAGFVGSLAGGVLGGYLNKAINSNIAQAADYQSNMRDMDKGDLAASSEEAQKAANAQKIADAVSKGLEALGIPQSPGNVYPLDDQFAGVRNPSFTDDWTASFTTHGTARESGAIPGVNPALDIKFYNDPTLGNIIAPVTPTNSLSHYLDFPQWFFGIGNPGLRNANQILEQLR